jgi:hypothetical protein
MKSDLTRISLRKAILFGAIAGFVGGIIMEAPMVILALMMGMPMDSFVSLIGTLFGASPESASSVGMGFHSLVSSIVGIIFAVGVNKISRFEITSYKKGIKFGMIPGMVAFGVLGIPLLFVVFPPLMIQMMSMMNPQMTQEMVSEQIKGLLALMTINGLIAHVVYGIVLGSIYSGLHIKSKPSVYVGDN